MRSLWNRFTRKSDPDSGLIQKIVAPWPEVWFLGEQAGPVEDDLKSRLKVVFNEAETVSRAYLAKVQHGPKAPRSVALCLIFKSKRIDEQTISLAGMTFHGMFSSAAMLDIIPITESQERTLSGVCAPFYEAVP